MEQWTCRCTAENAPHLLECWNCKRPFADAARDMAGKAQVVAERTAAAEARAAKLQAARDAADSHEAEGMLDMRGLLAKYVGQDIGCNAASPTDIIKVTLASVQADHLVLTHREGIVRVPFSQILRMTEPTAEGGSVSVSFFGGGSFPLVVEIFHLIAYKGGLRVGFAIPIGS